MGLVIGVALIAWIVGGLVWAAQKHPDARLGVVYVLAFLLVMVIFSQYTGIEWGAADDR